MVYWYKLQKEKCLDEIKDRSTAMIVNGSGDLALRVCVSAADYPLKMLQLLDDCYVSFHAATRISVLTAGYAKT